MPVFKFRSVDAMNQPVWRAPGDRSLYQAIAGLWALGARMQARRFPVGVHRHRSIEDLDDRVTDWHRAHMAARRNHSPTDVSS